MTDRRITELTLSRLIVNGPAIIANLIVAGDETVGNLTVTGSLTLSGSIVLPPTISVDTIQNETAGGPVTIKTLTANANIILNPNGTGVVSFPNSAGLQAAKIAANTGGSLRFFTDSNSDIIMLPNGTGRLVVSNTDGMTCNIYSASPSTGLTFRVNNNNTVLTIPSTGIAGGSSTTGLTLNGTNIETNLIVNPSANQALSNKSINSANNTIQVNGVNINSLVNQDVRTTAGPTFDNLTVNNAFTVGGDLTVPGVVICDTLENYTTDGDVSITAQSGNANVLLNPNGTGAAIVLSTSAGLVANNVGSPAGAALNLQTNGGTTRMTIPSAGIATGATSDNLLLLSGTTVKQLAVSGLSTTSIGGVTWVGFTGAVSTTYTAKVLFNGMVTFHMPSFSGTLAGNTSIVASSVIPINMRPQVDNLQFLSITNNAIVTIGEVNVKANGDMEFFANTSAGVFIAATVGGSNGDVYLSWATY